MELWGHVITMLNLISNLACLFILLTMSFTEKKCLIWMKFYLSTFFFFFGIISKSSLTKIFLLCFLLKVV